MIKHYLQFSDLDASEYAYLFERAALIKRRFKAYEKHQTLSDRTLALIFEKASTRTRVSFEAGMYQMGGSVVHLTTGGRDTGELAARLRGMPGVIEAVIVADEGVAYLKVDRDRFDDVALGEIVAGPA